MVLRLDINRKLFARSDRVKAVDFHPTEPWLLACLYNGNVYLWNYETQALVKTFEVSEVPVRAGRFVARKNWFVTGSDDYQLRAFNYNTHEKVIGFEAHPDYIRCLTVHPTQPFVLTGSDDMTIKLWDWEKNWKCLQVFEGHTHYVMALTVNPKDTNTFASACLDRTVKVWSLGSSTANFTLEAHDKGVNYVDYYHGGEKPYMVTTGDDRLVKIWDYQTKSCIQTLEGHTSNVSFACFHPELPIIVSGSEDGTIKLWHANTYRLENTLNYGLERVWSVGYQRGSNNIAFGYDEGAVVVQLGREEPAVSMDASGKVIWARHSEIQTANLKASVDESLKDGQRIALPTKDLGSCEVYPQTLQHSPNGRFVVVCGDGEYIIYTALGLRNKAFGTGLEFVWALDSNEYAVRETTTKIKVYKNFKEKPNFVKINFPAEGLFGGTLLGVKSASFLNFYDWDTGALVRRIEVTPKSVFWAESGELVTIASEDSFYVLRFDKQAYIDYVEAGNDLGEEGVEEAFEFVTEVSEAVKTGKWVGDCFIYTSSANRLNYLVGGQTYTISHFDKTMYLLGYIPRDNRIYLADKDINVYSYALSLRVVEYQTAVLRGDMDTAEEVLPSIPADQMNKIARFLEGQELKDLALEVSTDPEHRFDLAIQLKKLDTALELARDAETETKWKILGDSAMAEWKMTLAEECFKRANDLGGLLLLYTSKGDRKGLEDIASQASKLGHNNIAFASYLQLGDIQECLNVLIKTDRTAEAALMARTYAPEQVPKLVGLWKQELVAKGQSRTADTLADPTTHPELFAMVNGKSGAVHINGKAEKTEAPLVDVEDGAGQEAAVEDEAEEDEEDFAEVEEPAEQQDLLS